MTNINRVAKWGLILGVVMSISRIIEINMLLDADISDFMILSFEWMIAIVVYIMVIYRANIERATTIVKDGGRYGFRDVLNYSILISMFASLIVGISTHTYITSVVGGYAEYVEQSFASISNVISSAEVESESVAALVEQSETLMSQTGEQTPSLFSAVLSMMTNYIIGGFMSAIAIFWFIRNRCRQIEKSCEQ